MDEEILPWEDRRRIHDRKYQNGWDNAPEEFKEQAKAMGLKAELETPESQAIAFDDNYTSSAYIPDMALALDTYIDQLIERHGIKHAVFIRLIAADLKKPMEDEISRNRASLLGRIAGYLIYTTAEKGNILARIHALLHSIPRFAKEAGYHSMRSSARECRVSPEWLRRQRDKWCQLLEIEPPQDGTKTEEAKKAYKTNAVNNHWRRQRYKA